MKDHQSSPVRPWGGWAGILRLQSIKGKIFAVFILTLLFITALTAVNLWNLSILRTRMLLSEKYDDLLNNILEVRRFEKNYLIYGDSRSLKESRTYLDRIDELVSQLSGDLPKVTGEESFYMFKTTLATYRRQVAAIAEGKQMMPEPLRNLGKQLTDTADHFREVKRRRIHATILRNSMMPFAFFAIVATLMGMVIWLISHGLLKPLEVLVATIRRVGGGDFRPIEYQGVQLEEVSMLISAFNRMARELETNQEDLIQARKIAALGTFTAGIAHELNNPINNIVLTAECMGEEYGPTMDENSSEMLGDILGQAERAADIVKNLLDFSRTEHISLQLIDPARILTGTINLVKNQVKLAGVQIETSIADKIPDIRGNTRNLQQVFTNLLLNAIQATPEGGTITVEAGPASIHGHIRFVIEDDGPGIPAEIQHKIFEPFFSTKEVGKGTGLGLAVSYSIVQRHGGRIEVANAPGRGARFTVLLPVPRENPGEGEETWTA